MSSICPHFGHCGRCSRQDLPYPAQLERKDQQLKKNLSEFEIKTYHSIWPSSEIYFYRNKMEFSFGDESDVRIYNTPWKPRKFRKLEERPVVVVERHEIHLGLHPKGRFAIVMPTPECQLLSEGSQEILACVSLWATNNQISVYNRKNASGCLRHLVIREGKNTGERLVKLVARSETPFVRELAEQLKSLTAKVTTFIWDRHDELSDVAYGKTSEVFWGQGHIKESFLDIQVDVKPQTFIQTNTAAAEKLMNLLREWIKEDRLSFGGPVKFFDLYCGVGILGLNLTQKSDELRGIEVVPAAIQEAKELASRHGFANAVFIQGRVEDILNVQPDFVVNENSIILVDPPRAGLNPKVAKALAESRSPVVYYVSCNPESLARDLKILAPFYNLHTVQPMDFFPHTDHIETAVRLHIK
jgi:23S rRNA (uracil1939-C5)-methyltransferase